MTQVEMKRMEKDILCKVNQKKARISILYLIKQTLEQQQNITRGKKGHNNTKINLSGNMTS